MNLARSLSLLTTKSVKEVAAECGFNSFSGYCASFRSFTGMTPKEYRRGGGQSPQES